MKEKIQNALKTKYSNLGFSDKAFAGVADYLSTTVTEEEQIDNTIQGVESLLKAFQGDIDTRVSTAVAKAKADQKGGEQQPKPKDDKGDDAPPWAKALLDKVEKLETQKQQETLASKWSKAVSEKGIKNEKLAEKWMPKSEDDFDANLNDLVDFNKSFLIQEANGQSTGKPASGASSTDKVSKETQSKLDSWVKTKESTKQD